MSVEIDGENDKVVGFFLQFNPIFGYCFQFCLEMVIKKIFFSDSFKAVAALVQWEKVSLIPGSGVPSF